MTAMARARLSLLALLLLTGCGFQPLYAGAAAPQTAYPTVAIGLIPDREGQYLRNRLIDALSAGGESRAARLGLAFTPLEIASTELGIQKDATVTRTGLEISTRMTLTDQSTGQVLLTRDVRALGGYDVLDQQYATLVTRQHVKERTLDELARNVMAELDLYFRRRGAP